MTEQPPIFDSFDRGDQWREARLAIMKPETRKLAKGFSDGDWEALHALWRDFGGPWGQEDDEYRRRQLVVARYMKRIAPTMSACGRGVERWPAFSWGLLLASLREDMLNAPELYANLPPDDTFERFEKLKAKRKS